MLPRRRRARTLERTTGSGAQLRKQELFRALAYTPHPGQVLLHRSKARLRVLACGVRWGKSTCAAMETVAELLLPREQALGWLVAPTYDLTKRIFDRVVTALQQHLSHRVQEHRPREHTIVVTNLLGDSSTLRAKTADNPVSLLGEAIDFLIVDEAAQIPDYTWEEHLSPRLIDRRGSSLLLSTPRGGGWFYEAYKRGRKGKDPECESWRSPTWENPHLDRAVIEAERGRIPEEKFAQQYEAEFLNVDAEPCETCGGPQADAPGEIVAPEGEYENDFIPRCPACGMFTDGNGKCIVKFHNEWYASFHVDRPWSSPISMDTYSFDSVNADGRWAW